MLKFLCAFIIVAAVKGQGPPPSGGGQPEQDCVLLLTSSMFMPDDGFSSDFMDTSQLETIRYNESLTHVTGKILFKKAITNDMRLVISVAKFSNGKESIVFNIEIEMCKELELAAESDFFSLMQYLGIPNECPIEPGEYDVNNLVADLDGLPINSANIGSYQAKMEYMKCNNDDCTNRELLSTVLLDCAIELL